MHPVLQEYKELNTTPNVKMIYTPEYDVLLKKVNNKDFKIVPVLPTYNDVAMENYKNWFRRDSITGNHKIKERIIDGYDRKY